MHFGEQMSLWIARSAGYVALIYSLAYIGIVSANSSAEMLLNSNDVKGIAGTLREHPELLRDVKFIQIACSISRHSPYFEFRKARAYFIDEFAKSSGSVNLEDQDGSTPLMWCVKTDDIKLLKSLLQLGADIKHTAKKPLVKHKVIVKYTRQGGMSVLHWANNWSRLSTIKFLLEQGADPELGEDMEGLSPLEQAKLYNLQYGAITRLYKKHLKDPVRYSQPESFAVFKYKMMQAAEKKDKNTVYAYVDNAYQIDRDFGGSYNPNASGVSNFSFDFQFDNTKLGKEYQDYGWRKFNDMLNARVVVLSESICFVKHDKEFGEEQPRLCARQNIKGVWMFYKYVRGGD